MAQKGSNESRRSRSAILDKVTMEKLQITLSTDAIINLLKGEKVVHSNSQKPLLEVEITLERTEIVQDYYQAQVFIDKHWED